MFEAEGRLWWLAAALLGYCLLHSGLASLRCKAWVARRWPALMPAYRLLFNALALLLLVPVLALLWSYPGAPLWHWPGVWGWLADGLALLAAAAFLHSLGSYDLGEFSGTRQWRAGRAQVDGEGFRIGFWHRFVRHPWYCFILVLLWTREINAAQLLTYGGVSLYFLVGSRLEERKLIAWYGAPYREYRRRVPGLLPLPWKWLTRAEARALEARAAVSGDGGR